MPMMTTERFDMLLTIQITMYLAAAGLVFVAIYNGEKGKDNGN